MGVVVTDEEIEYYGNWFVAMNLNTAFGWTFEEYMERVAKKRSRGLRCEQGSSSVRTQS